MNCIRPYGPGLPLFVACSRGAIRRAAEHANPIIVEQLDQLEINDSKAPDRSDKLS